MDSKAGGSEEGADTSAEARSEHEQRVADHDLLRGGDEYQTALTRMWQLTHDFANAVRLAAFAFTRYPSSRSWLLSATTDEVLESSIAVASLVQNGAVNVARRELRYALEVVVKAVYCDQALPGETSLEDRIAWLADTRNVPRSSVKSIDSVALRMIPDPESFRNAVASLYGSLSGYTHVSKTQLEERLRRVARGEYIGFELPRTLRTFNGVLSNAYDVILALVFEGFGPAATGDVFVQVLDDDPTWRLHRGTYIGDISAHFDYKHERQVRDDLDHG